MRHIDQQKNVAMYRTNIPLKPVGVFDGNMVVSMRPIPAPLVELATKITGMFPDVHGTPVHTDAPQAIGIKQIVEMEKKHGLFSPGERGEKFLRMNLVRLLAINVLRLCVGID